MVHRGFYSAHVAMLLYQLLKHCLDLLVCGIKGQGQEFCNGLIVVKLKRNLKYKIYVYFEPALPYIMNQALTYLKSHNKCYEYLSI